MSQKKRPKLIVNKRTRQKLSRLVVKQKLSSHDETLLQGLVAVKAMTLDQIWRMFWPKSQTNSTARSRLYELKKYGLIESLQFGREVLQRQKELMQSYGLTPGSIYKLSN